MSLHLIELPDELVAWLRGGKQGPAPLGLDKSGQRTAAELIERAIDEPMGCGTCGRWYRIRPELRWGDCSELGDGAVRTAEDFTCSEWLSTR